MPWLRKSSLIAFLNELGAEYVEFQVASTWYGSGRFTTKDGTVYCDYALAGAKGIFREEPIIGFKSIYNSRRALPEERAAALEKFSAQLLACRATVNINPKLEGKRADNHAVNITKINDTWSVARVKIRKGYEGEDSIYVHYLVTNGVITSLPNQ